MGAGESRIYLFQAATGAALVKRGSGDCPCDVEPLNDVQGSNDGMWKIECYGKDHMNRPNLVYIRNDHHPQRALNSSGNLVNCSMRSSRDDELWYIEHSNQLKKAFALKNKSSGKYLDIKSSNGEYGISFQSSPSYWYSTLAKHAPTPGQVATIAALTPIAAVATAISGGAAGASLAGAIGWGTSVMAYTGATAAGLATISSAIAKLAMDPASDDWVVNKM